jgi:predicted transcriptional regulator
MKTNVRDTSLTAFFDDSVQTARKGMQRQVYTYIEEHPGCTDAEIADALGFEQDRNKVSPRRNELVDAGLVKSMGKEVCSIRNRKAYVWEVSKR